MASANDETFFQNPTLTGDDPLGSSLARPILTFEVYLLDEETDDETWIGQIGCDPEGPLSVQQVEADYATYLNNVIRNINQKGAIAELLSPSDESPRFSLDSRIVQQSDPDFVSVLQRYLLLYYGLSIS